MGNLEKEDSPESTTAGPPADDPSAVEIPEGVPPETRGSKQFALVAFIAIFVAILGSAVLYLTSRRGSVAEPSPSPPPVQTAKQQVQQPPVAVPPKPEEPKPPVAPVVASTPPPSPAAAPVVEPLKLPEPAVPQAGRWYLQVGSLEKGVADIMSQGLRIKGIPAMVAPGITPLVSRIIAGPFDQPAQMAATDKQLREMGFQPFPRKFDAAELREPPPQTAVQQPPPASPEPVPVKPDVRR